MKLFNTCDKGYKALNLILHALILVTFVTLLFFMVIKPQVVSSVNSQLFKTTDIIVDQVFDEIEGNAGIKQPIINNKNVIDHTLDVLTKQFSTPSDIVEERNFWLKMTSVCVIGITCSVLALIYIYIKNTCDYDIPIATIFLENLLTFIIVGIAEYVFFTKIVFKYSPVYPDEITKSVINNIIT